MLNADIEKYEADAAQLTKEIGQFDEDISTNQGDIKAATAVREKEHADFLAESADYQASVAQVSSGIDTLKAEAHDTAQSAALIQLAKLPHVSQSDKKLIQSYLAQDPEDADAESL